MDLKTWMKANKLSDQDVATSIGVPTGKITGLRIGATVPLLGVALKLRDLSKGAIDITTLMPKGKRAAKDA